MDAPEPETPFAAVTAQTTKFQRVGASVLLICERSRIDEMTLELMNVDAALSILPRQVNTLRDLSVGRHRHSFCVVRIADCIGARMVHWYARSQHDDRDWRCLHAAPCSFLKDEKKSKISWKSQSQGRIGS